MARRRRIPLADLEAIARGCVRAALAGYRIPDELTTDGGVEALLDGDDWVFELRVAGETPADSKLYARVRVHASTGTASAVEVFRLDHCPPATSA